MSSKDERRPSRVRLGELIPTRDSTGVVREPDRRRINVDEAWDELKDILEMKKIQTLGQTIGGMSGAPPAVSHGDDGLEKLAKVGQALGIDFTELTKMRTAETESLRRELDESKKREIQTKLDLFDRTIAESNKTVADFIASQNQSQNQQAGLFGVADQATGGEFTKMLLAEFFNRGKEEKPQQDPLESLINSINIGERIKSALGLDKAPEKPAVDPSLLGGGRIEVLRALLDDERQRKESENNFSIQKMKTEKLGGFLTEVKALLPDILAAFGGRGGGPPEPMPPPPVQRRVPIPPSRPPAAPQEVEVPPETLYQEIECPNEGCHKKMSVPVSLPPGVGIKCPHCDRMVYRADDVPDSAGEEEVE